MSQTNSFSSRFGDEPMAFNMDRYVGPSQRVMWRFGVSRYCGQDRLIEGTYTASQLREMRSFIDRAIAALETDGGRKEAGQ